ncbi:hypothetical protein CR513_55015, partial [Mucuna pruriens]
MGGFKLVLMASQQFSISQWMVVGNSLAKLIIEIFVYPSKVEEINNTLITLITKIYRFFGIKRHRKSLKTFKRDSTRDPLSPYLLVMYIEKLFQLINKSQLLHLAFVDDLLLFTKAKQVKMQNCEELRFQHTNDLEKYLEILILHEGPISIPISLLWTSSICSAKSRGEFGLRKMSTTNQACRLEASQQLPRPLGEDNLFEV